MMTYESFFSSSTVVKNNNSTVIRSATHEQTIFPLHEDLDAQIRLYVRRKIGKYIRRNKLLQNEIKGQMEIIGKLDKQNKQLRSFINTIYQIFEENHEFSTD